MPRLLFAEYQQIQVIERNYFLLQGIVNGFTHPLHQFVQRSALGVTAGKLRNGTDVNSRIVSLNNYVEMLHIRTILFPTGLKGREPGALLTGER